LKELVKNRTLVLAIAGITVRFVAGFSRGFFEAIVFLNNYPDDKIAFSAAAAVCLILGPAPGFFWVATYTDKHEKSNPEIRPKIISITCLATIPLFPIMYY